MAMLVLKKKTSKLKTEMNLRRRRPLSLSLSEDDAPKSMSPRARICAAGVRALSLLNGCPKIVIGKWQSGARFENKISK